MTFCFFARVWAKKQWEVKGIRACRRLIFLACCKFRSIKSRELAGV